MGGLLGGGGSSTTVTNTTGPMSAEEKELIKLNSELAQRQLANIDALAPFQQELLDLSLADLRRTAAGSAALDAAITPEQQAAFAKSEFERAQKFGPIQDELLQLQLDSLRRGGAATPEQIAQIREATDAGIAAGSADIDLQTERGIGLISDELANSRGMRLSDTPILREATLLARGGADQKASLTKNLRSAEATARLNHPLAVQQVQSGINMNQQNIATNAAQFQADLRQRAFQNRLALTGQGSSFGLGLASINDQGQALNALTRNRMANTTQTQNTSGGGIGLSGIGSILSAGAQIYQASDRRLKDDYGVVARTEEGVPLHLFKYKGEDDNDPLRLGVMADDMEKVNPAAVKRHSSGYKVVDYAAIR